MEYIENVELDKGVHIHIDYLSFTFPLNMEGSLDVKGAFEKYKYDIADLFYQNFTRYGEVRQFRQNGYENILYLGENITIRFGGETTKMKTILKEIDEDGNVYEYEDYQYSCQVELKGQGCREIEFLSGGQIDYAMIIDYFQEEVNGRCTRIDMALDDKDGTIISLKNIITIVRKGWYTSRFKVNQNPPKLNTSLPGYEVIDKGQGLSLYFGKPNGQHKADRECCIYDKKAERRFRKIETSADYYVRYEIRYRNELADDVAASLSSMLKAGNYNLGYFFKNEMFRMLKLRINRIDGNITRNKDVHKWDIHPKWAKFLDYVDGVKLVQRLEKIDNIEIKKAWNVKNITKQETIFDIADSFVPNWADGSNWSDKVFKDAYDKVCNKLAWFDNHSISERELAMINNYRRKQYGSMTQDLTFDDIEKYKELLIARKELLLSQFDLPF